MNAKKTVTKTSKTGNYELLMILDPEKKESEALSQSKAVIEEAQLTIDSQDVWGLRTLAYPIHKKMQGRYVFSNLSSNSTEKVAALKRELQLQDYILRFVLLKK